MLLFNLSQFFFPFCKRITNLNMFSLLMGLVCLIFLSIYFFFLQLARRSYKVTLEFPHFPFASPDHPPVICWALVAELS